MQLPSLGLSMLMLLGVFTYRNRVYLSSFAHIIHRLNLCRLRDLVCKVEEVRFTLTRHLAKEEKQLFPLLQQHFSDVEQAELIAQFLCCIPLEAVEGILVWLKPGIPQVNVFAVYGL